MNLSTVCVVYRDTTTGWRGRANFWSLMIHEVRVGKNQRKKKEERERRQPRMDEEEEGVDVAVRKAKVVGLRGGKGHRASSTWVHGPAHCRSENQARRYQGQGGGGGGVKVIRAWHPRF